MLLSKAMHMPIPDTTLARAERILTGTELPTKPTIVTITESGGKKTATIETLAEHEARKAKEEKQSGKVAYYSSSDKYVGWSVGDARIESISPPAAKPQPTAQPQQPQQPPVERPAPAEQQGVPISSISSIQRMQEQSSQIYHKQFSAIEQNIQSLESQKAMLESVLKESNRYTPKSVEQAKASIAQIDEAIASLKQRKLELTKEQTRGIAFDYDEKTQTYKYISYPQLSMIMPYVEQQELIKELSKKPEFIIPASILSFAKTIEIAISKGIENIPHAIAEEHVIRYEKSGGELVRYFAGQEMTMLGITAGTAAFAAGITGLGKIATSSAIGKITLIGAPIAFEVARLYPAIASEKLTPQEKLGIISGDIARLSYGMGMGIAGGIAGTELRAWATAYRPIGEVKVSQSSIIERHYPKEQLSKLEVITRADYEVQSRWGKFIGKEPIERSVIAQDVATIRQTGEATYSVSYSRRLSVTEMMGGELVKGITYLPETYGYGEAVQSFELPSGLYLREFYHRGVATFAPVGEEGMGFEAGKSYEMARMQNIERGISQSIHIAKGKIYNLAKGGKTIELPYKARIIITDITRYTPAAEIVPESKINVAPLPEGLEWFFTQPSQPSMMAVPKVPAPQTSAPQMLKLTELKPPEIKTLEIGEKGFLSSLQEMSIGRSLVGLTFKPTMEKAAMMGSIMPMSLAGTAIAIKPDLKASEVTMPPTTLTIAPQEKITITEPEKIGILYAAQEERVIQLMQPITPTFFAPYAPPILAPKSLPLIVPSFEISSVAIPSFEQKRRKKITKKVPLEIRLPKISFRPAKPKLGIITAMASRAHFGKATMPRLTKTMKSKMHIGLPSREMAKSGKSLVDLMEKSFTFRASSRLFA